MKARMPEKRFGRDAEVGDILCLGRFMKAGSPAPDKEPGLVFRGVNDPFVARYVRFGCVTQVLAPLWSQFDQRCFLLDTRNYDPRSMHKELETRILFLDTQEVLPLSMLPLDTKFRVIERENYPKPPVR